MMKEGRKRVALLVPFSLGAMFIFFISFVLVIITELLENDGLVTRIATECSTDVLLSSDYKPKLFVALTASAVAYLNFMKSIGAVSWYLLLLFAQSTMIIFPPLVTFLVWCVDFHRHKLSTTDVVIEICAFGSILICYIFQDRMRRTWTNFEGFVRRTSSRAADAARHVLFFSLATLVVVTGQKLMTPLASKSLMPVFSLFIPLLSSGRVLIESPLTLKQIKYRSHLCIWVILATYHAFATLVTMIPFFERLVNIILAPVRLIPLPKFLVVINVPPVVLLREFIVIVVLWTQVSKQFAEIVYLWSSPLLGRISANLPSADFGQGQLTYLLTALRLWGVINVQTEKMVASLFRDGVAILLGLLFVLTPLPHIGSVLVCMVFPALSTSKHLVSSYDGQRQESESRAWLQYWICFACLWLLKVYDILTWPIFIVPFALWLQHSYFRGSQYLFESLSCVCVEFFERNRSAEVARLAEVTRQRQQHIEAEGQQDHQQNNEARALGIQHNSSNKGELDLHRSNRPSSTPL